MNQVMLRIGEGTCLPLSLVLSECRRVLEGESTPIPSPSRRAMAVVAPIDRIILEKWRNSAIEELWRNNNTISSNFLPFDWL
ncbi:hypothetical protein HN873_053061 [Arachis hypogaea]